MVIVDLKLSNFQGGLLQSAFVVSYVVFAPVVGYLGDRYSRRSVTHFNRINHSVNQNNFFFHNRAIMGCGLLVWSIVTMAGSYMATFETLLIFRYNF